MIRVLASIAAVWLLPACSGSETERPCTEDRGLVVRIQYSGVGDACGHISVVQDVDVQVTVGDSTLTRVDALRQALDEFEFEWPADVVAGAPAQVTLFATGEGVIAEGAQDFEARPAACQVVLVQARCCSSSPMDASSC